MSVWGGIERRWAHRRRVVTAQPPAGLLPLAVVTGGSEGIGLEIARGLVAEGRAVMLIARDGGKLAAAADALRAGQAGASVRTTAIDLTHIDAAHLVVEAVRQSGGYIDMLVNNAGVGFCGPFAAQPRAGMLKLLDLNMRVLADLTHRVLPDMTARGQGGVLNVASIAGLLPGPQSAAYYASKAFVVSLTEAIAHELRGTGVRIAVVLPGPVATEFHAKMGAADALYMRAQPAMTAATVAKVALAGYRCRRTVIVPGFWPTLAAQAVRYMPHVVSVPMMGVMLGRRVGAPGADGPR